MPPVLKVMILCPTTKQRVDTGIKAFSREALNSGLLRQGIVSCPHCNKFHSWQRQDTLVEAGREEAMAGLWRPNA